MALYTRWVEFLPFSFLYKVIYLYINLYSFLYKKEKENSIQDKEIGVQGEEPPEIHFPQKYEKSEGNEVVILTLTVRKRREVMDIPFLKEEQN